MRADLTISRAAKRAGVGVETIRFYERRGLIKQPLKPRNGGFRCYNQNIVERIRFIRQAQELGFSLREIKELLSLRADPTADCGDVRTKAIAKRTEVERKIGQLQHMRAALDELITSCPGGGALRTCSIIDALNGFPGHKAAKSEMAKQGASRPGQRCPKAKGHGVKTVTFKIDGMHCDGCARAIEALVATEPGVRKATVSYQSREARVLFEPDIASEDRLADLIRKAGYSVAGQPT